MKGGKQILISKIDSMLNGRKCYGRNTKQRRTRWMGGGDYSFKQGDQGTSLVVQWLRLHSPNARGPDLFPGQGIRSHMVQIRSHILQLKILHATTKTWHCVYVCSVGFTLCDTMVCSPLGFSVHGIFQVRILEWVAIPFSRRSSQTSDQTHVSSISCIGRRILYHQRHLGSIK